MYKLLVVDDENELRNGLCNYFPWGEVGFECLGYAEDGQEAMMFIKNHHVDVILSDIIMPIMTGIDLAREIYNRNLNIRVIFLSGYKDFEYAQQAIIYGVKNYILKPTKYKELVEVFLKVKKDLDFQSPKKENGGYAANMTEVNKAFSSEKKIISTIKEYISKNYKDATLEGIAALIHMHPFYISKIFKQNTGQNFSEFVMDVRMKKASEFLMDIKYKTYEVSELIGYSNSKNFTRTFKCYFGITPREYRNSHQI